ncbi:hypothetical protein Cgig2_023486 [Carnegiea gigantea]|uniref:Phytocyanin domain-containing protein n=1 Tax=Carnegiea gigantea TaxID=171969 RepID=A0A9Q1JVL4_9CARY|nr:hypothetical protein Cgig2_023486 [Carnegiea gigantea]
MARGGMIKNMAAVTAAVMMLMLIKGTASETLTVGDDNGWSRPSSADFYTSWAAEHTFSVGDILVMHSKLVVQVAYMLADLNFSTGSHTVVMVTSKDAHDKCDPKLDKNPKEFKTGPAQIPLTGEGEVFFFCTVGSHCSLGQKLAINVVAADAKPLAPANSPSPPESRQDTGSAPKPMALTLSTFCLSLMALWVQPPTLTTYAFWASSHFFVKEDVLVFNFNNGIHNVAEVTKEAYKKCNKSSPISIHNQSPVRIPLPKRGKRYFISTLNNDCENGLKLAIKVLNHLPPPPPPSQPPSISPAAAPGVNSQVSAPPSTTPTSTLPLPGPPPPSNSAPSPFGYASLCSIQQWLQFWLGFVQVQLTLLVAQRAGLFLLPPPPPSTPIGLLSNPSKLAMFSIMATNQRLSLVLALILGAICGICSAATIIVGGGTGWTIPTSPSFYSTWASHQTFKVGDVLVFNFVAGAHTVAEVSKAAYGSCNTTELLSPAVTAAPARLTIKSSGAHYFICTIPGHCPLGQKLAVAATAASSSPSTSAAAPQPSAAASPPTTTTASAPQPSAAASPPTTTAASAPSSIASGSSAAVLPPAGNLGAPTTAGVSLFSLLSVIAVGLLFNLKIDLPNYIFSLIYKNET